jgi:hypothetical protein
MRFSRFFLIPLLALLSSASHLQASTSSDKNAPPQLVTIAPTISPWDVTFTGYGWMSGIDAQMAVNGYTASTSFGVDDILRNLDMIAMFNVEIRRGRLGGWIDGIYLDVSSGGDSPGSLLDSLDVSIQSIIAEAALFYRVWESDRGFLDLYGGARYMQMSTELGFNVSDSGIRELSAELSTQVFETLRTAIRDGTAPARQSAQNAAIAQAQNELAQRVDVKADAVESKIDQLRRIAATHPRLVRLLKNSDRIQAAIRETAEARVAAGIAVGAEQAAIASNAVAAARQTVAAAKNRAQKAVANAERNLAKAIERELKAAIPSETAATADWVDPFIGLRARCNLTDRFYAVAKADVGGFGIGSELVWQAYGGFGYQFSPHVATELGYRHFSLDYSGGSDLTADMQMSGVVLSLLIHF